MKTLSKQDRIILQKKGISEKKIEEQLQGFVGGFPFISLVQAATIDNDGIVFIPRREIKTYIDIYDRAVNSYKVQKFVPASGAATRMFKSLFAYCDELKIDKSAQPQGEAKDFFDSIKKFAFYGELKKYVKDFSNRAEVLKALLEKKDGLGYGSLPKGLLLFHQNGKTPVTAVEEHLIEGAGYAATTSVSAATSAATSAASAKAKAKTKQCAIHFTVSPEHLTAFKKKIKEVLPCYEEKLNVKYKITYSIQSPATDTVAVTLDNKIFRDEKGNIVFRPGGHGALIENINALDADMVFIKNIDNVTTQKLRRDTIAYKKFLGGYLISVKLFIELLLSVLQGITAECIAENTTKKNLTDAHLSGSHVENIICIVESSAERLSITPDKLYSKLSAEQKIDYWKKIFNRPIRVCGMVKNEGELGGGPFFVKDSQGRISLQIVESSQVEMKNAKQKKIFSQSTHFNPVDLVCWIKNYEGEKFDLTKFTDPSTAFISEKSVKGKSIKAMELPGLWNGAMADWITVFVEVPSSVFTPVKTVTDLLRPQHQ
jgi:hypothetical protein